MSYFTLPDAEALERFYRERSEDQSAIARHLPRLRMHAADCAEVVEFGVKMGGSTAAFLLAAEHVTSYDIKPVERVNTQLQTWAGDAWTFRQEDTRFCDIPACDVLFVDADHTFGSVDAELRRHAGKVRGQIIFHDTLTFGSIGANGETGQHLWQYRHGQSVPPYALGIRPAIDLLMMRDPDWVITDHYLDSHGLLVLSRRHLLRAR